LALACLGGSGRTDAAVADPCAGAANPIVCENQKTGNPSSEWDISGMGDPSIQGFATEFSVGDGEDVVFKVKTDALDYRLDIYRMGYYGGLGARKVATLAPSAPLPQTQPGCLSEQATGLVDCGNWAESARWSVPPGAVSGIYFAHLVRTDTGGDSHVFFVVRDDDGASDLLFQTSDTTWQAYNRYGGNSLYVGAPAGRAYKVSYNRPFTTRDYADPSFVWSDEYPMVRWLERNGYDVSYFSGIDTERRGAELLEHRAFLSVGHDEYWSAGQRTSVENARGAGIDLAFFSSNEMFWKTRWENAIDGTGTPYRTLVSYKETHAGAKIDPTPVWTGTWRDARFSPPADGARPENAVTGQLFTVNAYRNDPMRVPSEYRQLRLWRNTSVASLLPGQVATFANGILGHEWDEDVDNGHRPPGLFRMSSTTIDVDKHLTDAGNTYVPGTATHGLTMYKHASGALVFGAGTSQWSWALDAEHDYFSGADDMAADQRIQQATVNLFADMGAQPATRQSNLVAATASTDATRPSSTITSPTAGTEVHAGETLVVSGTASDTGGGVVGGVEVSVDGGASWHPANGRTSWSYTWTVSGFGNFQVKSRAVDDSGNLEVAGAGVIVSISCPCSIWNQSAQPGTASANDTKAVNLGVKFRPDVNGYITGVRYYRGPLNHGTHVGSLWTTGGVLLARATFTGETATGWQEVKFDSPVAVTAGTTYVASYFAPVGGYSLDAFYFSFFDVHNAPLRALADGLEGGNGLFTYASSSAFPISTNKSSNYWVDVAFDPILRPDTTPPTVTDAAPANGATGVDNRVDVTVTFSEGMTASTIGSGTFSIAAAGGAPVPAAVAYDPAARTATLTPTVPLAYDAGYTVTLLGGASGVKDLAGNALATTRTWSFTTLPPPVCPCSLWSDSDRPSIESSTDPKAVEVGVKFRPDVPGYVTGIRYFRGPKNNGTHTGSLWTASGTRLAKATFTGETATGWQQVVFDAPVPVAADTTYVASYFTPTGGYALGTAYFSTAYSRPPLRALKDGVSGGNGVFLYTTTGGFPTQTSQASNYWVDVVFDTILRPDVTPPRVAETSPAAGSSSADHRGSISASFSEAINASTVSASSFELRDASGNQIPATVSFDPVTRKATLDPSVDLAFATQYVATVKSTVQDTAGNAMAEDFTWAFSTAQPRACPCSIWPDSARPATAVSTDNKAVELGVKFRSDADGFVSAIRFYKGSTANGGTHTGSLWTESGTLLGQATFVSETGSGWQTAYFTSPIPVTADTTYVASYFAPLGRYSLDLDYFLFELANPPLRAPSGTNGLFSYGATSRFPTSSNRSSNYWVDVIFERAQLAATAPGTAVQPGTSNPVATGAGSSIALDFGAVAAPQNYGDVFSVTNVSEQPQTFRLSVASIPQLERATFASTGETFATIAPGDSTTVSVLTSDRAAGRGSGRLELMADGLEGPIRSFASAVETAPAAVTGLTARPGPNGRINLAWPASATTVNLLGYHVYRSTGGDFTRVTGSPVNSTSWSDTTSSDGTSYTYMVRAIANGPTVPESGDSPTASAQSDATAPSAGSAAPVGGSTAIAVDTAVSASFSEAVDQASLTTGFELYDEEGDVVPSSVSYDAETGIATLTPSEPLGNWRPYTARIRGGTGGVTDLAGNPVPADYAWTFSTVTPFLVEPGPAVQDDTSTPIARVDEDGLRLDFGLVHEAREFDGVLKVTNVSAAQQDGEFQIEGLNQLRWIHFESSGSNKVTLAPGESSFVAVETSDAVAGYGTGFFRLQLQEGGLYEDLAGTIFEAPEAPSNLTATALAGGSITLSWPRSSTTVNLAGYDVYRATSGSTAFTKRNAIPLTGTTYDDTATVDGTTYDYVVRAVSTDAPALSSVDSRVATVRADSRPSSIQSVFPASGAVGVPTNSTVRATFDEPMNASTITTSTIELRNTSNNSLVSRTVSYNASTRTVTITPNSALIVGATYRATIKGGSSGVADLVGNRMATDYSWTFSTRLPITIAPGTANQPNTSTRIATGNADTLSLNFGLVPSARTITSVFSITNTASSSLPLTLAVVGVPQLTWARFASNNSSTLTLGAGATASVSFATSSTVAGYGAGSIRLSATGSNAFTRDYPAQIREAPQAPASNSASARPAGQILVSWGATTSVTNLLGYDVYRSSGGGAYAKRNSSPVVGTSYTDGGTTNGTTYSYRVRALSTGSPPLQSAESPTASAVADSVAPAQPTTVTLANGGGTGNAYINLANRASVSVGVTVPSSAVASDTLTVTLSIGSQSVTKTSPSRNGAGTVTVTGINATSLADGTITISATAKDVAGNTSAARTRTNTKDTVAPGIPTATYVDRTNPTVDQITGTAVAGATVRATRTAPSSAGPYTATAAANGSYTINVAASRNQTVTYQVAAIDAAGNASGNRTVTFTTTR
jgi:hypothetical protein